MEIKVNRETKLDYDKILDGIVWVFAIGNENHTGKFPSICYDLRDRNEVDNHGYPIYKGRFGNSLIALRYAKTTDKLYLMDKNGFDPFRDRDVRGITANQLEKYAVHTIVRS